MVYEKMCCYFTLGMEEGNNEERQEMLMIIIIVPYTFILLNGRQFFLKLGKFDFRLTCVTISCKIFSTSVYFLFSSIFENCCICKCTLSHVFIESVILHRWQQICCIFHAQLKRNLTTFPCIMERSTSVPHLIRSILIMLNVFWLPLRKLSKYT